MKVDNYTPIRLPPSLDWHTFASALGHAREALARYDEVLKKVPNPVLEILKWEESVSTIRSQKIETSSLEILKFQVTGVSLETRAPLLQKTINAKEALDLGIAWSLKNKPLNLSFLCKLHAILKKDGPNPEEIGRLRKRQNWIGVEGCPIEEGYFFPPKAHLVPKYINDWQRYQNAREEPLVQLAILFAQILIIHPFMDGNGRVARIHIPAFLYKKKLLSKPFLFLSAYFEDHLLAYFQKLFNISEVDEWEEWILYFLKGVIVESETMKSVAERLYGLYLKVGEEPFLHPVSLQKRKTLIESSEELFVFEPLFEIIR